MALASAKSVSPPNGGFSRQCSTEPSDGAALHVTSECHVFSVPGLPGPWPIASTSHGYKAATGRRWITGKKSTFFLLRVWIVGGRSGTVSEHVRGSRSPQSRGASPPDPSRNLWVCTLSLIHI